MSSTEYRENPMCQHYKDLIAWQKAMDLVAAVYAITEQFPKRETYSVCDQIRRASSFGSQQYRRRAGSF